MTSITSPALISGTEALSSLICLLAKYTGGDSSLGRRASVRLSAGVVLLALAIHSVASGRQKRNAIIQKDPGKVGKVIGGAAKGQDQDDFDEYDLVIVGGGI
jgi:hypothetical protein